MSGFQDHFSSVAEQYRHYRPSYPDRLFDYLSSLCTQRRLCWDCATGSGQVARSMANRFERVVATDASFQQVAAAEPQPRIQFCVALAEQSPLADESVDLLTVAQAIHWFDQLAFNAEIQRVVAPAGIVAVWSYGPVRVNDAVDAVLNPFYSETLGDYWPAERKMVDAGLAGIELPFRSVKPETFSLAVRWNRDQFLGYLGTWSAVSRYLEQNGEDPLNGFAQSLESCWPKDTRLDVRWPLAMHVAKREV